MLMKIIFIIIFKNNNKNGFICCSPHMSSSRAFLPRPSTPSIFKAVLLEFGDCDSEHFEFLFVGFIIIFLGVIFYEM